MRDRNLASRKISDSSIQIPGYFLLRRDRVSDSHGGVCIYISEQIHYEHLIDYQSVGEEVLWVKLRPNRLPRGISCNCGIMLVGDFKTASIQRQCGLKQVVKLPTRGSKTLHIILTNLSQYYTDMILLSLHRSVFLTLLPKQVIDRKIDLRPSNKVKLGSFVNSEYC